MLKLSKQIDFAECANRLAPVFPNKSQDRIAEAVEKYFYADERSEYIYYTNAQIEETINDILRDFVAENQNEWRAAAKVAVELGMEILPASATTTHPAGAWL